MARLDVYQFSGRGSVRYVLDVQADALDHLRTRAVVPLMPKADAPPPIGELNPVFDIGGQPHVMLTQAIATVPVRELRDAVISLSAHHDLVVRALDILLVGF